MPSISRVSVPVSSICVTYISSAICTCFQISRPQHPGGHCWCNQLPSVVLLPYAVIPLLLQIRETECVGVLRIEMAKEEGESSRALALSLPPDVCGRYYSRTCRPVVLLMLYIWGKQGLAVECSKGQNLQLGSEVTFGLPSSLCSCTVSFADNLYLHRDFGEAVSWSDVWIGRSHSFYNVERQGNSWYSHTNGKFAIFLIKNHQFIIWGSVAVCGSTQTGKQGYADQVAALTLHEVHPIADKFLLQSFDPLYSQMSTMI